MMNPESLPPSSPTFPITELEIITQQFEMNLVDENIETISLIKPELVDKDAATKFCEYVGSLWDVDFREDYDA